MLTYDPPPARAVIRAAHRWPRHVVEAAADDIARNPDGPTVAPPAPAPAPEALSGYVVAGEGGAVHPPLRRMLAWAALLSARGGHMHQPRVLRALRDAGASS